MTRSRGRYRAILESWQPIALDVDIAENAARLQASLRLKLADAVQAASALAINAAALVTYERDLSRVRSLRFLQATFVSAPRVATNMRISPIVHCGVDDDAYGIRLPRWCTPRCVTE